ncbi:MAG: RsmB/NOP family class I SAM-dependent RNA methyltransferase [Alphaproteobacteria bacterium]|nr:RsmB/NOP family class I SAM-dependent RNA methyltransferase [Alphaproteobacteria bacterium]
MQYGSIIQSFIELLEEICAFEYPADRVAHGFLKQRRYFGSKDRRQLTFWLYDFLRHYARISHALSETMKVTPTSRLYALAYLRLVEKCSLEDLESVFNDNPYHASELTLTEKKIVKALKFHAHDLECPEWILPYFERGFKADTRKILESLNVEAPCDLRVNLLLTDRETVLKELDYLGIEAVETPISPWGIRLLKRINVTEIEIFKKGWIEIQDEGSQLVALSANPKTTDFVVDLCAGACGKTLAFSALMKNKGRIIATDIDARKLENGHKRIKRAGISNIQLKHLDPAGEKWLKRQRGKVDIVLVDAPCTGTGTWRRNPDHKWRLKEDDLKELVIIQASLLNKAALLIKPKGVVVYATCSLLQEENEHQISQFLESHPEFMLEEESLLKLDPFQDKTDGFFCARLVKR